MPVAPLKLYHNPSLPAERAQDALDDAALEQIYSRDEEVEYRDHDDTDDGDFKVSVREYAVTRFTSF